MAETVGLRLKSPSVLEYEECNGKFVVINPIAPGYIVTNSLGIYVLKLCDGSRTVAEVTDCLSSKQSIDNQAEFPRQIVSFIEQAIKSNIFTTETIVPQHKPYLLKSIYLNVVEHCNLSCRYCYATARKETNQRRLGLADYKRIIDETLQIIPHFSISFTGGEPLLSKQTLPVAQYAKSKNLDTFLLTNGTLINGDNVKQLMPFFDHIKISIDGSTAVIHDYYRGAGNYEKSIKAIELLLENNADVTVAMVVTRHNANDVAAMNKKWGKLLNCQPLFPAGNAMAKNDLTLSGAEYYEALCNGAGLNPYSDIANIIEAHNENRSIHKCAMGDGEFSISCTGDVYPCQLLHVPEYFVGNVHEQSVVEIYNSERMNEFKQHTVEKIEGCKTCTYKLICGGACQARHYYENGTIDKAGNFCEYEKQGIIKGLLSNYELVNI